MAHFAQVVDGIVVNVIVVSDEDTSVNGVEQESVGVQFFNNLYGGEGGTWIQTSYHTTGGIHLNGGTPLRANFAGIGMFYDAEHDIFYHKSPYPSWTLNYETGTFDPPKPFPTDGFWRWDEETQNFEYISK